VLLDIGSVLGGFALAVVAFVVVILVCVIILRLLAVILPPPHQRPDGEPEDPAAGEGADPDAAPPEMDVANEPSPAIEATAPDSAHDHDG
jgi:hypothetical protein